MSRLPEACAAEFAGTFILVFLGVGSVHAAVLTGAQTGLWQVAVVWAVAVALGIFVSRCVSGAHLNPAITVAAALWGRFSPRRAPAYVAAQLAGAFVAAAVLHAVFGGVIAAAEAASGIARGAPGSEAVAMVYGEYFPNPALAAHRPALVAGVSPWRAGLAEGVGAAVLAFMVFGLSDRRRNHLAPCDSSFPFVIGLTVAALISVLAPISQAGFNPARDLGPRLFAWLAGWGRVAIPGPQGGWLTVYVLAPVAGAALGAGLGEWLLVPAEKCAAREAAEAGA